jgi:hypothetical protein
MGMQAAVAVWRHMKPPPRVQPDALPGLPAPCALAGPQPGPVVTLYAPLLRTLPGAREKAYQAAVAQAAAQLAASGVSAAESQRIARQLASVETDPRRFPRRAAGLAVFHDRTRLQIYPLPAAPARSVTVAENFALRPWLAAIRRNRSHGVLALSHNRVALFRGDAFGLSTLTAQGVPASLAQEADELALARFHRKIARAIEQATAGRDEPIVLIATPARYQALRAALRLPCLLPEGVQMGPDHLSPSELHALCWPIVERSLAAEDARIAEGYPRSAQRGQGLDRIDAVAAAAAAGRVHRLWVKPDERMPGALDPSSGALLGGRAREDVFDALVTLVLRHGGEVIVADGIPSGGAVAAELH